MIGNCGVSEINYVGTLSNAICTIGSFVLIYLDRATTKKYDYDRCDNLELNVSSTTSKEKFILNAYNLKIPSTVLK